VITLKESLVVDYNSRSETIALKHSLVKEEMRQLQKDNTKLQGENEQLVVENTELKSQVSRLQLENEEINASLCKLMGSTVDSLSMIALQGLKEQLYTTLASVAKREIVIREEEKREKECALCMENPRNIMLKPCNHVCMCEECAKKVVKKRCPICIQVYRSAEKLHI
jgi:predicted nuclease with TOPRIM domain